MPHNDSPSQTYPSLSAPTSERDISFPRRKRRWIGLAVAYRLVALGRRLFGTRRMLRFALNANWIFWRLSYELSMEHFGPEFPNNTYGVSPDLLRRWIPPGGSVVDIGCGVGRLCQLAAPFAGSVVGIDYDETHIGQARRANLRPNVEFRVGDVTTALPNQRFDLALLVAVLEHIEDVDSLLRSIRAVASRLIVEVPDFEADCLNAVRRDLDCVWYTDADHVREYTQRVLGEHLARNGWRPSQWERRGGMLLVLSECEPSWRGDAPRPLAPVD
jgi:SAM-dependent methyltransferase